MQSKIDLLDTEYSTWQVTAQFYDQYSNTHWALMQRSQESNGWLNYRLCVLGSSRKKRSYWLAWNRSEQRFARSTDSKHFCERSTGAENPIDPVFVTDSRVIAR